MLPTIPSAPSATSSCASAAICAGLLCSVKIWYAIGWPFTPPFALTHAK